MSTDEIAINKQVEDIYVGNRSWLHHWLTRRVGCADRASDFTHDTFLKILTRPSLEILGKPRAFLAHIANHLVIDDNRRARLEQSWLESIKHSQPQLAPSAQHINEFVSELERVTTCLKGLKEKPRRAFLMYRLDGFSQAEIAQELGVSISSVKKYIAQALLHCVESSNQ